MVMVAEGVPTVKAIHDQIKNTGIDMPILEATYQIIYEGADPKYMVQELMDRDLKEEF
jgi:glycerol-3-phosphate dehydrogenase (NAD(P)+)